LLYFLLITVPNSQFHNSSLATDEVFAIAIKKYFFFLRIANFDDSFVVFVGILLSMALLLSLDICTLNLAYL